ncbi:Type 1 glutamine amidotransferase-like domain-containing protein [Corynebacterium hindlerae]|uniref:Type 1 glutamine amidotransferase-like domain-containing protein n=1 Tax=Corynebacterium hindlerae TaxID=699041 RepID=A0A7G5FDW7_9CORY|nr:Type 1 glutamine amidotransferase-like domain-containing protein [Corynebacterium hindlerae]QMV84808.1 Type 1 glutamine amidotransferase-like domain-containing protein [Corynebacterium hindlerae]QTH59309.1 Type 1 glutamine amidotransferase-like domain-containing protein [Corynebacterium hindlerae]
MMLILTSFLHPRLPEFVSGKVAYIGDAARSYGDAPWVLTERNTLVEQGFDVIDLPAETTPLEDFERILSGVDAVYVAGGETCDLLYVLRSTGAFDVLKAKVEGGLTYIGTSAGSVVAGPSIEPIFPMDSPDKAPELKDYTGLGLTQLCVVPHASGTVPAYPVSLVAEIVAKYGEKYPLQLLRDGQALVIEDGVVTLI